MGLFAIALILAGHRAVTFSAPAMAVPQLLSQLAPMIGEPLMASSDMADEVLFVQVQAIDAARLMNLIADLSWGKWEATPKGPRLVRDKGRLRQGIAEEAEETGRRIQTLIPTTLRQLGPWDAASAARRQVELETLERSESLESRVWLDAQRERSFSNPAQRGLARLLLDAPASRLGAATPWSEGHFGSEPNRMQAGLGDRAPVILKAFSSEETSFEAATQLTESWYANDKPTPAAGSPHAVINLHREEPDSYRVTADFLDENDKLCANAWMKLTLSPYSLPDELRTPSLSLSPWVASKNALADMGLAPIEREREPLAGIGEGLSQVAITLGDSIVASIPDEALSLGYFLAFGSKKPTQAQFLGALKPEMRFAVTDGLIVGRPVFGGTSRTARVNRKAFRELTSTLSHKRFLDFDDLGTYFQAQEVNHDFESFHLNVVRYVGAQPWLSSLDPTDRDSRFAIRFWTQLDPSSRDAMQTRNGIPLGRLGEGPRHALEELVFAGESAFSKEARRRDNLCDATIGLPNGLPDNVLCSAKVEVRPAVFLVSDGKIAGLSECEEVGKTKAWRRSEEEHGGEPQDPPSPPPDQYLFLPDVERCVTLTFRFPNRQVVSIPISDHAPDFSATPGDEDSLPDFHRRAIRDAYLRNLEKHDGGDGGLMVGQIDRDTEPYSRVGRLSVIGDGFDSRSGAGFGDAPGGGHVFGAGDDGASVTDRTRADGGGVAQRFAGYGRRGVVRQGPDHGLGPVARPDRRP